MLIELRYDETHAVQRHDAVEVRIGGPVYHGLVTRLYPRSGEVQVRYWDYLDTTSTGGPRSKSARVPLRDIELVARDG